MRKCTHMFVCLVLCLLASGANAKSPAKASDAKKATKAKKATQTSTKTEPKYTIKMVRDSCLNMGDVAFWDIKKQRCLLRAKPKVSPATWIAVGVLIGAAVVGTATAVLLVASAPSPTKKFEVGNGTHSLW